MKDLVDCYLESCASGLLQSKRGDQPRVGHSIYCVLRKSTVEKAKATENQDPLRVQLLLPFQDLLGQDISSDSFVSGDRDAEGKRMAPADSVYPLHPLPHQAAYNSDSTVSCKLFGVLSVANMAIIWSLSDSLKRQHMQQIKMKELYKLLPGSASSSLRALHCMIKAQNSQDFRFKGLQNNSTSAKLGWSKRRGPVRALT